MNGKDVLDKQLKSRTLSKKIVFGGVYTHISAVHEHELRQGVIVK